MKLNENSLKGKLASKTIINRRKKKLEQMLASKDNFFSEEAIRQRDPILYEIYVGSSKRSTMKENLAIKNLSVTNFLIEELDREIYSDSLNDAVKKEEDLYGAKQIKLLYVSSANLERNRPA
jgi:hypothetical protein